MIVLTVLIDHSQSLGHDVFEILLSSWVYYLSGRFKGSWGSGCLFCINKKDSTEFTTLACSTLG
jgi:hypothetical protein